MSRHEQTIRKAMDECEFAKDEVTAALCDVAMERDLFDICNKYGLCAERSRHATIVEAIEKAIAAAQAPPSIHDPQQVLLNPPGWIALAGKWQIQDDGWLIGSEAHGFGRPALVWRQMPSVPFTFSFSVKNLRESREYIRLDIELGQSMYRYQFKRNRLYATGPDGKEELVKKLNLGQDKTGKLQIQVNGQEVALLRDGKQIHALPKTGDATRGLIRLYGRKGYMVAMGNFTVTEHK